MIRAERLDDVTPPPIRTSPGVVDSYVQDASGMPAGHAEGLVRPVSEAEAAAFLRVSRERGSKILPQAARTSKIKFRCSRAAK